jgi:hypothetical protein
VRKVYTYVLLVCIAIVVLAIPITVLTKSNGAADGFCGDPTTLKNCTTGNCHNTYPLNSGDGYVTVNNLPAAYEPSTTYSLEVELADADQTRWGFQLTILTNGNQQAGTITVTDAVNTWLKNNAGNNPDYLNHSNTGTYAGTLDGPVYWGFNWNAPAAAAGTVHIYLAGCAANNDAVRTGDYVYTDSISIPVANHDVAVTSLDNPQDSLCVDTTYAVTATVANNGNVDENFSVIATINSTPAYADTIPIFLASGGSAQVTFKNWTCPAVPAAYTLGVVAVLTGDAVPGNNTQSKPMDSHYCAIHDVSVTSITAPADSICINTTIAPAAVVTNYGNVPDSFNARCTIQPGPPYSSTVWVHGVAPGGTSPVVFGNWTVPAAPGTYTVAVKTLLANDMVGANDSLDKQTTSYVCTIHDRGIMDLVSPPLSPCVDTTYHPTVRVVNYGNVTESFSVELLITPGYTDTFDVVSLLPGDTSVASFKDWATDTPYTYQLSVNLSVAPDVNPANDTLEQQVVSAHCWIRDLQVVKILLPSYYVCADSTVPVMVRVRNNGEIAESLKVGFHIPPMLPQAYHDTVRVYGLQVGETRDISFDNWHVTWLPVPDTLPMISFIIPSFTDHNPNNDFARDTIYVYNCPGVQESSGRKIAPSFGLVAIFPNPAARSVNFSFGIERETSVKLDVLDVTGRVVRTLVESESPEGFGHANWDLRSDSGEYVRNGVYFARLTAGGQCFNRKFVVIR